MKTQKSEIVDNHLLIIGGSCRNIGKTTLALDIIKNLSSSFSIIGLKVSTHRKGEDKHHGNHASLPDFQNFITKKEDNSQPLKDTSRMLAAGAKAAYYIQTKEEFVLNSFIQFKEINNITGPIICESRSLRLSIKPGLFIFLIGPGSCKQDKHNFQAVADYVHYSDYDLKSLAMLARRISYDQDGWHIQ
jgi:hypothetical protein